MVGSKVALPMQVDQHLRCRHETLISSHNGPDLFTPLPMRQQAQLLELQLAPQIHLPLEATQSHCQLRALWLKQATHLRAGKRRPPLSLVHMPQPPALLCNLPGQQIHRPSHSAPTVQREQRQQLQVTQLTEQL